MAYITKEQVAAKRKALNELFPKKDGWKISVVREDHSSINVCFLAGPVQFSDSERTQINHYHIDSYENKELLKKALDIINEGNFDKSDPTTDYFYVGFYVNVSQGRYGQPFKLVNK